MTVVPHKPEPSSVVSGCRDDGERSVPWNSGAPVTGCGSMYRGNTTLLSMWMRMDALPNRTQALVLTDGYEVGRVRQQVNPEPTRRVSLPLGTRKNPGVGYGSPTLITPRSLGAWNFLCSVYDRKTQVVRHFFNGRQVSSETMIFDHAVQFGIAEIGNWGVPIKPIGPHAIRNFIGRIDELTIWNTALEEQEIAKIHSTSHP